MRSLIAIALVGATQAVAQDGVRGSDRMFTSTALSERLSGQSVEFFDDSRAFYRADGSYAYAYTPGDNRFRGVWETTEDSRVCVTFENGSSRCDIYVLSGDRLVLIVAAGDRYPARSVTAIE